MANQTIVYMLALAGLTDVPNLQLPLFLVFSLIYLMTLTGNLLIVSLIFTDFHLHTQMYFFIGTLACLDVSYSSVTTPRILFDLLADQRLISLQACLTQIFFFLFFVVSEVSVLAVMSYDRYIAICRPLHYMQIMSWKVCVRFVSGALVSGLVYSLMHSIFLTKLTFCSSNPLQSLFCDLPQLLEVSCSDTFINVLFIFVSGVVYGIVIIGVTVYPYIPIITTLFKSKTSNNIRSKAFSTCSSHLTVVIILYSTFLFNYYRPNSKYHFTEDKVASVFYAIVSPMVNPLIYSLRNKEVKTSLRRTLQRLH